MNATRTAEDENKIAVNTMIEWSSVRFKKANICEKNGLRRSMPGLLIEVKNGIKVPREITSKRPVIIDTIINMKIHGRL